MDIYFHILKKIKDSKILILIIIILLEIMISSCKNNESSNEYHYNNYEFNNLIKKEENNTLSLKIYFNKKEAYFDHINKIIVSSIDIEKTEKLFITYENEQETEIIIDNITINKNQNIKSIVLKNKKISLKTRMKSNQETMYNLYFSNLPILSIDSNEIENFPNVKNAYLSLSLSNQKSKFESEIKINTRGRKSLKGLKKSFAIYTNEKFSDYIFKNLNFKSKQNTYILYASDPDSSLIRDQVGHEIFNSKLSNHLSHEKISGENIDLFINGKYWGIYFISNTLNTKSLKTVGEHSILEMSYEPPEKEGILYKILREETSLLKDPFHFKFHKEPNFYSQILSSDLAKCDAHLEKSFDKNYAQSFLSTILSIQGNDNVVNNTFLAIKNFTIEQFVQSQYNQNQNLFFIPWDMDQSFGNDKGKLNYNKYNILFKNMQNKRGRGSLLECYLNNVNEFKAHYKLYWLNKNNIFPGLIKNLLINKFKKLDENFAYEREFIRWKKTDQIKKFDKSDLNIMLEWVDLRFQYLEEVFLKIPRTSYKKTKLANFQGKSQVIHKVDFNLDEFQLELLPAKNKIETHEDASARTNAIAVSTGGFFEYYYMNKNIHKNISEYLILGENGCNSLRKYPTENIEAIPVGINKVNDKYHSTSENAYQAIGWNENGEYVLGRLSINISINLPYLETIKTINIKEMNVPFQPNISTSVIYNDTFGQSTRTPPFTTELILNSNHEIESLSTEGNSKIPKNGHVISFSHDAPIDDTFDLKFLELGSKIDILFNYAENIEVSNTFKTFKDMKYIRSKNQNLVLNNNVTQEVESTNLKTMRLKDKNWMDEEDKLIWMDENFFPGSHPRSALCINDNKNWSLYVVDGRQPNVSEGMTIYEFAHFLKDEGCMHAVNFDGGSSATINYRNFKVNVNSGSYGKCTNVSRPISDFLIVKRKKNSQYYVTLTDKLFPMTKL